MNINITAEEIEDLFNSHPGVEKFFFTHDGQAFFDLEAAGSHACRLIVKEVTEINLEDLQDGKTVDFVDGLHEADLKPSNALIGSLQEFVSTEGGDQTDETKALEVPKRDILAEGSEEKEPYINPVLKEILAGVTEGLKERLEAANSGAPAAPVVPANTDIKIEEIQQPVGGDSAGDPVQEPATPAPVTVAEKSEAKPAEVAKPAAVKKATPAKKAAAKPAAKVAPKVATKPAAKPAAAPAVKQILTPNN